MRKIPTAMIVFLSSSLASGYFEGLAPKPDTTQMNDIKFSAYSDFPQKWHMVTVRYREDSKEIRVTYANDKAWKEMKNLKPNYPDGAAFAKIAFASEQDPAFQSSRIPSRTRRYQIMLKAKEKYKETEGWGYALFNAEGTTFADDPKTATLACAACHRLVPERDYVFSRVAQFNVGASALGAPNEVAQNLLRFVAKKRGEFKGAIDHIDTKDDELESLEGELQKHGFSGTLDEIVPVLVDRARKLNRTSILYLNESNFTIVKPLNSKADKAKCLKMEERPFRTVVVYNKGKVRDAEACL